MDSHVHSPPIAREQGLLWRELPEGMIVYDEERYQAHSLNRTAALVWRHCDGQRGVSELTEIIGQEMNLPAKEEVVWLALDRLEKAHLLQEPLDRPTNGESLTRRAVIRKLGLAGGLAALLPVVGSLGAPLPAFAQSPSEECTVECAPCQTDKLCCSGPSNVLVCNPPNSENCRESCPPPP